MAQETAVGIVTGITGAGVYRVDVGGETHTIVAPGVLSLGVGQSVSVLRHGLGRLQIQGLAGHWAPGS